MADKVTDAILDALKQSLSEPGEQRLYKSGKLDGLFAGRGGVNGEAAARALREDLLEVVRTEIKGKTTIEWVRSTPKVFEYLQEHESPVQVLKDLQAILQVNREHVPMWLAEMQAELKSMTSRLSEETQRWSHRLDSLSEQINAALRRSETTPPIVSESAAADAPWAQDALAYLDKRRSGGMNGECPLPELFAFLHGRDPEISLTAFHDRLRRLRDRRALRLLPFPGQAGEIPEPEYALLDGPSLLYYASR